MPHIDNVFSALADASRRKILLLLTEKELPVNAIAGNFKVSRPAISKHLGILQKAKLVVPRRDGRERYYRLNPAPLTEAQKWLQFYDRFWDEKLGSLKHLMEKQNKL
jgi:DNA-binding transcriptional ArsR family regulator